MCKTLSVESGFPLIGNCAEANAVQAQYLALNRAREDAVGAKRGYVLLRFSATMKVRRERSNASQVGGVNLTGLFRISPIIGLKYCYARLQEGTVISIGN
jgi:hypothetical protein